MDYDLPAREELDVLKAELGKITPKTFNTAVVPRSGEFELSFQLDAGTVFYYEFKTEDYDVGFGIKYQKVKGHPPEQFSEIKRYESNSIPVWGKIHVEKPGVYTLIWDNSYSWTRSKDLLYITSVPPTK